MSNPSSSSQGRLSSATISQPGIRLVSYDPPRLDPASSYVSLSTSANPDHDRPSTDSPNPWPRGDTQVGRSFTNWSSSSSSSRAVPIPVRNPSRLASASAYRHSTSSSSSRPQSRRQRFVALHAGNKTFTLVAAKTEPPASPLSPVGFAAANPLSAPFQSTAPSSRDGYSSSEHFADRRSSAFSSDHRSSVLLSEHRPSSHPAWAPDPNISTYRYKPTPSPAAARLANDQLQEPPPRPASPPFSSSSSNYVMTGGVRKVPKSPELHRSPASASLDEFSSDEEDQPFPLPATAPPASNRAAEWLPQSLPPHPEASPSLSSSSLVPSDKPASETANYKTYSRISPASSGNAQTTTHAIAEAYRPSSGDSNYRLLAITPSPSLSPFSSPPRPISESPLHFDPNGSPPAGIDWTPPNQRNVTSFESSSPQSSFDPALIRSQYSHESLMVAPLQVPASKTAFERLGLYLSRSRESMRATSSASASDARTLPKPESYLAGLTIPQAAYIQQGSTITPALDSAKVLADKPSQQSLQSHLWSSQLSTVPSESDNQVGLGSRPTSRSFTAILPPPVRRGGRLLQHLRHIPNISTSSQSQPVARSQLTRVVNYQDEDGDGLGDLAVRSQQRPSRSRIPNLRSAVLSDRNIHSSASSGRVNSFTASSTFPFPTWAKLYYGSGERRLRWAPSSESLYSAFRDEQLPSPSPTKDAFVPTSFYSRHHPPPLSLLERAASQPWKHSSQNPAHSFTEHDASQLHGGAYALGRVIRRQTSSIWSPHLRHDRRAGFRHSLWDPPSPAWSIERGPFGRRNFQVISFVVGFVFPFAWMIAALRPLPPQPGPFAGPNVPHAIDLDSYAFRHRHHVHTAAETRYNSAVWWRKLNRLMSLVGLGLICVIVVFVVLGVR